MDLTLSSDQETLLGEVSSFLRERMPTSRLHERADGPAELKSLAELGWVGISVAEADGGLGFSTADEVLVFRELGRVIGPISTFAGAVAVHTCDADLREQISIGAATVAVAHALAPVEPGASEPSVSVRLFSNGVPTLAVLPTRERTWLFELTSGIAGEPLPCLEPTIEMRRCDLRNAKVIASSEGPEVYLRALLLISALNVGAAEAIRDLTAEYAKIRTTFGKPIGSYQAVRHPIAEMAARCEQARLQICSAAMALDLGRKDRRSQVNAARILAQQAATAGADWGIQLHGAIGITDEYDAHLYMKRAALLATWFGGTKAALADLLHRPIMGFDG